MLHSVRVLIPYYIISAILALLFGVVRLAKFIPCTKFYIRWLFEKIASIKMREEDYWETAFGWEMLQSVRTSLLMDLNRKASSRQEAANPVVFSYDGRTQSRLLEYGRENRPLVVNFGSITCPVFRKRLEEYFQLIREYEEVADFVTVYIEEAYPSDGWKLKNNYLVKQHKALQERCNAARCLAESIPFRGRLVVDSMDNECNISYSASPIRLYIITNGCIQFTGGIGPTFYKLKLVDAWLDNWKKMQPLPKPIESDDNNHREKTDTSCIQETEIDHNSCSSSGGDRNGGSFRGNGNTNININIDISNNNYDIIGKFKNNGGNNESVEVSVVITNSLNTNSTTVIARNICSRNS